MTGSQSDVQDTRGGSVEGRPLFQRAGSEAAIPLSARLRHAGLPSRAGADVQPCAHPRHQGETLTCSAADVSNRTTLRPYGLPNSARIEKARPRVDVMMHDSDPPVPLEVPTERVEEFAEAARQIIDARLEAHPGECPDFWKIVAGLYIPASEEDSPADDKH